MDLYELCLFARSIRVPEAGDSDGDEMRTIRFQQFSSESMRLTKSLARIIYLLGSSLPIKIYMNFIEKPK
jgi:hypothetical protein